MLSNEERRLVCDSVLLPMLLEMINVDLDKLGLSKQTFRPLFQKAAVYLRMLITADLTMVKREMISQGIRVIEETQSHDGKSWRIIQRGGYEESFGMLLVVIRSEVRDRMSTYINNAFKPMKNEKTPTI